LSAHALDLITTQAFFHMRGFTKAALFKVLSTLPGGTSLYRHAQEKVTKSLIPTRERVEQKITVGLQYLSDLEARGAGFQLAGGTHLDFGAGWHPTIPLLYYSLGTNRQYLLDIAPILRMHHLTATIEMFRSILDDPAWPHRARIRRLPSLAPNANHDVSEHLAALGMHYRAPFTGRWNEMREQVDAITCTQVLQHLNKQSLLDLFRTLRETLKPGGRFLATIHMVGHFQKSHTSPNRYHHLQFSPWVWDHVITSSLMYLNRLKGPDYRELLEQAGFRVEHFDVESPTPQDYSEFTQAKIHSCFKHYKPEDLAGRHLYFIAVAA
jgi:hypothetical protein